MATCKVFSCQTPPLLDLRATINIETGGKGGGVAPNIEGNTRGDLLADFLPSPVTHPLDKGYKVRPSLAR